MMDLFDQNGKFIFDNQLSDLTEKITSETSSILKLYSTPDILPEWLPALIRLLQYGSQSRSQPVWNQLPVKKLITAGWIKTDNNEYLHLTPEGEQIALQRYQEMKTDAMAAFHALHSEAGQSPDEAPAQWKKLLNQKPWPIRMREEKKRRESKYVEIVTYEPQYQPSFKALNEDWISTYFQMEENDHKVLDDPEKYILDPGGEIFVALYKGDPVGVCALIQSNDPDYDFEMGKMAVSPYAQGKSIGWLLGQAIIAAARERGASRIYLESNTRLKPAIHLYQKMGFKKIPDRTSPFRRTNIHMEMKL